MKSLTFIRSLELQLEAEDFHKEHRVLLRTISFDKEPAAVTGTINFHKLTIPCQAYFAHMYFIKFSAICDSRLKDIDAMAAL